ncbi:T6SS phospholipase effector Tle1-like catalytic domain-containing protein [Aspergillus clavatus NRRL 1]|uniref:T6SS Phospholipase effector Tle1-like catalytic domain-containing protein n=1 Tax=Aspergillus clavatus (strain ATCC 1007 / CBS 513.65 / DSM 816 / NCTC 3887 / NRRL 1 / QM 1276 / 107) TaxID=344612 RepID=A1C7A3_ASPCL|nr:uncharacterized protein ACLA_073090 [Aspergillus clavatus NRRL 1]EAW14274.1 conserved hypothetical protein [Aspergillus clavatus NRRL 1]
MYEDSFSDSDPPRELVLCFDGTGNTFRADGGESNILKIFRMLDRTKQNRSGIGTDITPGTVANLAIRPSNSMWTQKAFDLALATSFDQHVIRGYRFLARRWVPGAKIYLFGFSRGAYTARFLNEMLDYVGLISADNEEIIPFVWEAFTRWKFSERKDHAERANAMRFLSISRETMCRPVGQVHFLGLFDTVNSVAEFNKESCTHPSPRTMRHAVSIDERRIKFQPVLFESQLGTGSLKRKMSVSAWRKEVGDEGDVDSDQTDFEADFEEVYFAGNHGDVGGGWVGESWPASHIPLMWMVQEAIQAGLTFEELKIDKLGCHDPMESESAKNCRIVQEAERAMLHDSLDYDSGRGLETLFWRVLEWFPFKRPKVAPDGSVHMTRWHTRGMRRPLPKEAKIHGSVIRRLRADPEYRPFNLGLGNKPNDMQKAEEDRDIGQWRQIEGNGLRDYWVKV